MLSKNETEYYRSKWSNDSAGIIFVRTETGYVHIQYDKKENGQYGLMLYTFFTDLETVLQKHKLVQISKLDAIMIINAVRNMAHNL